MAHLIALCGKKQSGKTTLSNYIHGHEMKRHDLINDFWITNLGSLYIKYGEIDEKGNVVEDSEGPLDLWQNTEEFYNYASTYIWPLVRGYNFADPLKEICMSLFGLTHEQCYGTDEEKSGKIEFNWDKMPGEVRFKSGYGQMTAREFMQYFGAEIMRKINPNIWVDNCIARIKEDDSPVAIISDCRYINEIEAVKKAGGKVIKLTRDISELETKSSLGKEIASHSSEVESDGYDDFDAVIDNQNMTIQESVDTFLNRLIDMGVTKRLRTINTHRGTVSIK